MIMVEIHLHCVRGKMKAVHLPFYMNIEHLTENSSFCHYFSRVQRLSIFFLPEPDVKLTGHKACKESS